jgi:hypothetical protein
MTEDVLFICHRSWWLRLIHDAEEGKRKMSERDEGGTVIELLLREPEIVAWLEPSDDDEPDDDEPPAAA